MISDIFVRITLLIRKDVLNLKISVKTLPYEQAAALPRPEHKNPKKISLFWRNLIQGLTWVGMAGTQFEYETERMELLPKEYAHLDLKPVGRLDKATEGLLLFTNDGDLLHRLICPKKEVPKVYYARHAGRATQEDIAAFRQGLVLRDGLHCLPAKLEPVGEGESLITVCEGKYHQVRRMMASRQMTVEYLQRLCEGPLTLGDLPRGQVRELRLDEINSLDTVCDE